MLTAYDQFSARAFEAAGIEALLVGDSVGTTVLGHSSTTATTHQDMLTFTGAVARSVHRPLLVADLAFGTYEAGPMAAVHHAVELVRAGAEMVKLEGGSAIAPRSEEHTSELQSRGHLVCRLLLEKKNEL